jgi:hypothetical protein
MTRSSGSCRFATEKRASKVKRVYDDPQTPYARLLASPYVSDEDKAELREAYGYLDLVDLRRRIDDLQVRLLETLSPDR